MITIKYYSHVLYKKTDELAILIDKLFLSICAGKIHNIPSEMFKSCYYVMTAHGYITEDYIPFICMCEKPYKNGEEYDLVNCETGSFIFPGYHSYYVSTPWNFRDLYYE